MFSSCVGLLESPCIAFVAAAVMRRPDGYAAVVKVQAGRSECCRVIAAAALVRVRVDTYTVIIAGLARVVPCFRDRPAHSCLVVRIALD